MRSVENVLQEMRLLRDQYGIEEIMFEDDNVTADAQRAKSLISRMIAEGFNFVWDTPNGAGVWSMDEEMIDLMKGSGCIMLNFPVESGSQRVLRQVIKKPVNLEKVRKLIAHCQAIGLGHSMFLVIGMPGETLSEMWESVRFAGDCGCYAPHISVAALYPGTQLYETCVQEGYFSRPFSLDDLFIRSFLIETPDWTESDLKRLLTKATLYLKLRNIIAQPSNILDYIRIALLTPSRALQFFRATFRR
jgi:radical SAM superfamily enzyme YgiQ (UPF0313 family)